jgi:hypothetical protein
MSARRPVASAVTVVLAAAVALSSCRRASNIDAPFDLHMLPLQTPPGSGMPQITVSGDRAILSWLEIAPTGATLKYAERIDAGWTEPRTAASGTDWFVNAADVPSVALLKDGTFVAQWLVETNPDREAYDIRLAFSHDEGRTWTAPIPPHHDGTTTQHGFVSLFPLPASGVGMVWLDGRQTVDPANDNMSVRAATFDSTGAQRDETLVDDRVCDCCPTSGAITSDGPIVAYRDRSGDEIRDIAVSRLINTAWTAARIVHDDHWQIEACPVNGPALSADGRRVAVAWFTAAGDQGRAFVAFSDDAGATFGEPIRVDDRGATGRVGVALTDDGSAVVSWMERVDKSTALRFRRVARSAQRGPARDVAAADGSRPTGYPRLVRRGNEILFAWTESHGDAPSLLHTAAAVLPR